jgi:hypothetical protein
MRTFLITADFFSGEIEFTYSDEGYLTSFNASRATLSEKQHQFIIKRLPQHVSEVAEKLGSISDVRLNEVINKVTFNTFWNRYNEKVRSSKKKAELKWMRMSQGERNKAYYFISKYEASIPQGVPKKYAETYLNAELWNN